MPEELTKRTRDVFKIIKCGQGRQKGRQEKTPRQKHNLNGFA